MRLPKHLRKDPRTGIYYLRLTVPERARAHAGKREHIKSLRTREPAHAMLLAYRFGVELMSKKSLTATLPNGITIRTETAEEEARFYEFLKESDELASIISGVKPAPAMAKGGLKYWNEAQKWIDALPSTLPKKTRQIKRKALEDFRDFLIQSKREGLGTITASVCYDYQQSMAKASLSEATQANKLLYLSQFFDAMRKAGRYTGENPAKGLVKYGKKQKRISATKNGAQPFTHKELARIFNPGTYPTDTAHGFFVPLVCLFTGCRGTEIAQARFEDFKNVAGVWCLEITDRGARQSVKSEASARLVPLHPSLVGLGLLDYVQDVAKAGATYLFEYLASDVNGLGNAPSKIFNRYIAGLEITAEQGRKTLHSLRDTVISEMKAKGVPAEYRAQFVGHSVASIESDHYASELTPAQLAEKIFPAIDWPFKLPTYSKGGYSEYLRKSLAKSELVKQREAGRKKRSTKP